MEYVVYCINNIESNRKYIGCTKDYKRRMREHKRLGFGKLKESDFDSVNERSNRKKIGSLRQHNGLYLDMRADSKTESDFIFEVLEVCQNQKEMLDRENYWIKKNLLQGGYNCYWTDEDKKNHSTITKLTSKQWRIYRELYKKFMDNYNCP